MVRGMVRSDPPHDDAGRLRVMDQPMHALLLSSRSAVLRHRQNLNFSLLRPSHHICGPRTRRQPQQLIRGCFVKHLLVTRENSISPVCFPIDLKS